MVRTKYSLRDGYNSLEARMSMRVYGKYVITMMFVAAVIGIWLVIETLASVATRLADSTAHSPSTRQSAPLARPATR